MPKKIDMTGWRMSEHGVPDSKITVIKEVQPHITKGGNKQIQYLCKCDCGRQFIVKGQAIRNGNTKSCGCLHKQLLSKRNAENSSVKIGNRYGKLVVIKDLGMRKQNSRDKNERWSLCQCDCGSQPIQVKNNMLQNGWKKSCGCMQSQGEFVIQKILKDNNIQYLKEYYFEDLKVKNYLRFDFAIFKNNSLQYLIEFDGRQHFTGPEASWKNTHSLEKIQQYDNLKNEYCIKNNIILKRIPYTEIKTVDYGRIISNEFNIKGDI